MYRSFITALCLLALLLSPVAWVSSSANEACPMAMLGGAAPLPCCLSDEGGPADPTAPLDGQIECQFGFSCLVNALMPPLERSPLVLAPAKTTVIALVKDLGSVKPAIADLWRPPV